MKLYRAVFWKGVYFDEGEVIKVNEELYIVPAPEAEAKARAWDIVAATLKKYEFTVEDLKGIAACLIAADEPTDATVMDALADALAEAEGKKDD